MFNLYIYIYMDCRFVLCCTACISFQPHWINGCIFCSLSLSLGNSAPRVRRAHQDTWCVVEGHVVLRWYCGGKVYATPEWDIDRTYKRKMAQGDLGCSCPPFLFAMNRCTSFFYGASSCDFKLFSICIKDRHRRIYVHKASPIDQSSLIPRFVDRFTQLLRPTILDQPCSTCLSAKIGAE